ncbi:MFS transporter [Paraburkholderia sp. GAS334]|uniref:MFS transporter n=1 Tax=Paraburkholderia sp. GAS334 TaxID=3035131 RepID=UPI003D227E56
MSAANENESGAQNPADSGADTTKPTARQWLSVVSVALTATVFCAAEFMPVGLLRYISDGLWVSEGTAGEMVTAPGILAAIAAPVLTVAVGRHDRRLVLWALGALLAASSLIAMLAPNFPVLILGRVLFGIGLGGFWAIGAGVGGRLVPEKHVAKATSIIFAGVSIGMLVGGWAGALIGDLFGWRAAFGVTLVLSVVALGAQVMLLPSMKVELSIRPSDLFGIVSTRKGKVGLLAMFFLLSGQFGTYTYVTPFLAKVSGFDGQTISSILLGYTLIGLLGNFVGGAAAGRNVKAALSAAILLFIVSVLLLPVLGSRQAVTLVLLAVWGVAYGAIPIALQVWMVKAAPDASEGAMALFVANFQLSIAVGSFVGGLAVDGLGLLNAMTLGGAAAVLAIAILWAFGGSPVLQSQVDGG